MIDKKLIDLHIHSSNSDGKLTFTEIITTAKKQGLNIISITDHDNIDGYENLINVNNNAFQLVVGVELSVDLPDNEVHILGYDIDTNSEMLRAKLSRLKSKRKQRVAKIIEKLHLLGYVVNSSDDNNITGRPHIANLLVKAGYFPNVRQAFSGLLFKNGPAYVPHSRLTISEATTLIRDAKGKAIIAHPGQIGDFNVLNNILKEKLVDGIEVYHPSHSDRQTKFFLKTACKHKLFVTGGSDFHGIQGRFPEQLGIFYWKEYSLWQKH